MVETVEMLGKQPNLVLPHRRLVCYCRLYEVTDATRRERPGLHQREVFLFNDILVVTKIFKKKQTGVTYLFRQSFPLAGLNVSYFESHRNSLTNVQWNNSSNWRWIHWIDYPFGIRLWQRMDGRTLFMFNARNDHDRSKFCEDLREAILETDEMESLRIETEMDKQRPNSSRMSRVPKSPTTSASTVNASASASTSKEGAASASSTEQINGRDKADNRDSGVVDMDHSGSVLDRLVPLLQSFYQLDVIFEES